MLFSTAIGGNVSGDGKLPARQPTLVPIVLCDFQNDAYSINGIDKTFEDLFVAPATATLVAGEGLEIVAASETVVGTPALFEAVAAGPTCSGVLEVSSVDAADWLLLLLTDGVGGADVGRLGAQARVWAYDASTTVVENCAEALGTGKHRIAFTISQGKIACSVNGGNVVTGTPTTDISVANAAKLYLYSASRGTIRSLRLYNELPDDTLPLLSAAPVLPLPLVVSDFKNGVYSINGAAKAVTDLWVEDTRYDGCHWDPATDIVAGTGFVSTGIFWPPPSTLRGAVGTAAFNDIVLQSGDGFTAVIECTIDYSAGGDHGGMYLEWEDLAVYNTKGMFYFDDLNGPSLDDTYAPLPGRLAPVSNRFKKIAVTLGQTCHVAQDGSKPLFMSVSPVPYTLDDLTSIGFSGPEGLTIHKITFYPRCDPETARRLSEL